MNTICALCPEASQPRFCNDFLPPTHASRLCRDWSSPPQKATDCLVKSVIQPDAELRGFVLRVWEPPDTECGRNPPAW